IFVAGTAWRGGTLGLCRCPALFLLLSFFLARTLFRALFQCRSRAAGHSSSVQQNAAGSTNKLVATPKIQTCSRCGRCLLVLRVGFRGKFRIRTSAASCSSNAETAETSCSTTPAARSTQRRARSRQPCALLVAGGFGSGSSGFG